MANYDDTLKVLTDLYKKDVEEGNMAGLSSLFKVYTEALFVQFKSYSEEEHFTNNHITITPIDVKYCDGYFLFGFGDNSVVNFHIKETPGWLYGIWYHPSDDKKEITTYFFAQYEEAIDKFKPSASVIKSDSHHIINDKILCPFNDFEIINIIKFIVKEPELAFCRDYHYWDYNVEYHSRDEAKAMFERYKRNKQIENEFIKESDNFVIKLYNDEIIPMLSKHYNGVKLIDHGNSCCPRFELYAPVKENSNIISESGAYSWFDNEDDMTSEEKHIVDKFKYLIEDREKLSDVLHIWWSAPDPDIIIFYDDKSSLNKDNEDADK